MLPAYLVGLGLAGVFARHRDTVRRLRTTVFALLTPFYFLNAGMKVYLPALWAGLGLVVVLLAVKMATKVVGVWPLTRFFGFGLREGNYTTLLMSTGLTFGTISALFGLNNGYINEYQYSILVTVVIASAIVPTMIAQAWFKPRIEPLAAFESGSPATSNSLAHGDVFSRPRVQGVVTRRKGLSCRTPQSIEMRDAMFNKILAAIDGSPASEKVLAAAVDLAAHYQAELIALSVAEMPEVVAMVDEVDEIAAERRRLLPQDRRGGRRVRPQPRREAAERGRPRPRRRTKSSVLRRPKG